MKVLNKIEIEGILAQGKSLPSYIITSTLDELEREHPGIYRIIYGEPSDVIALINKDMANLYLDLSFDVIWVFKSAFGNPPTLNDGEKWALNKLSLLDAELKSLTKEIPMNDKFRRNLQERFVKRSFGSAIQLELLQYLEQDVKKYASFNKKREMASQVTTNMLFVLVRLMGDLYSLKSDKAD